MVPRTEADQFILTQVGPTLEPGENILLAAYLMPVLQGSGRLQTFVNAATRKAAFAALTERRLLLVETRIGAFAPLLENQGLRAIDRGDVKGVFVGANLWFELVGQEILEYQNNASHQSVSTQLEFFRRLPELFGKSELAAGAAQSQRTQRILGLVIGLVLAAVYVWYRLR